MTLPPARPRQSARPCRPFTATVHSGGRVELEGNLDLSGLGALRAALEQALFDSGDLVPIDAEHLSAIDSRVISELLRYQLVAAAEGCLLCFEHMSRPVAEALDVLDLGPIFMAPDDSEKRAETEPLRLELRLHA